MGLGPCPFIQTALKTRSATACYPGGRGGAEQGRFGVFALVLVGFTACAEFGSYAFFHPVLRALEAAPRVRVEQGLLKTVGRAIPVLMPVSSLLVLAYAVFGPERGPVVDVLRWAAVPAMLVSVVTTLLFNVPINSATARWDADDPPPDWERTRRRWEAFQGVRA